MKLWLDDVRPAPTGWCWVKTAWDAISTLEKNEFIIDEISLDHDLGNDDLFGTGYDVMKWIEEAIFLHDYKPPKIINFHTTNPVRLEKMKGCLDFIEKYKGL